ncbi:hypothetical protein Tco_0056708 [Tanacetum coccineum]
MVTMWGNLGELLIEKKMRHVGLYPIVLTSLTVKHYNNRLYLSSTSSTLIIDDDKVPALKELKPDESGMEISRKPYRWTTEMQRLELLKSC